MFVDVQNGYDRDPWEKIWRMLRECSVDSRLLMAVESWYSCSEIYIRVGGVK